MKTGSLSILRDLEGAAGLNKASALATANKSGQPSLADRVRELNASVRELRASVLGAIETRSWRAAPSQVPSRKPDHSALADTQLNSVLFDLPQAYAELEDELFDCAAESEAKHASAVRTADTKSGRLQSFRRGYGRVEFCRGG